MYLYILKTLPCGASEIALCRSVGAWPPASASAVVTHRPASLEFINSAGLITAICHA